MDVPDLAIAVGKARIDILEQEHLRPAVRRYALATLDHQSVAVLQDEHDHGRGVPVGGVHYHPVAINGVAERLPGFICPATGPMASCFPAGM